ncbi:MAG: 3-phosphoshikimate 1-carboxyvinyltransferase [Gemmatimonadetes bacterium 21-71-4]|nr:MAG: 3-phosphoshikimate 1-carboxyvinyltransferase [Gemmatimonadetes bacterium 21-71-4]
MKVGGRVRVPGDKSISHRALILAALGSGQSLVRGILDSQDIRSTASVLRAMGVDVPALGPTMAVDGVGLAGLRSAARDLDCGNSGTTTRLLAGVAAARPLTSRFVGDESLSRRPMRRIIRPLEAMGARVHCERGDGLPMVLYGAVLQPVDWNSEVASAQVKSAVLLAGLVSGVRVSVSEPFPSRDHTERMLSARGVNVRRRDGTVTLEPVSALPATEVDVPADPSSAAFFAGLAAVADTGDLVLDDVCVNPTRTGFLQVLRRMGARVEILEEISRGGEPVATLRVSAGVLQGTDVGGDEVPSMIDELPLVACLGARADGVTRITGAGELRVKESDRIRVVVQNLRALGVRAEELPDGLVVHGTRAPLRGPVATHGDHRIAMAFGVLGATAGAAVEIDDPSCVDVSFPGFWDLLRRVAST